MQYREEDSVRFEHIGRKWHIYRADMESLWENMDSDAEALQAFADDERLPYWAELWPSSFGLAAWLAEKKNCFSGKACVDLGCGLGFTALCGTYLGARVLACDYEANAVALTDFNARKNALPVCAYADFFAEQNACLCPLHMDWRKPCFGAGSFSFIWAADIAYERKFMPEILKFLDYALAEDGVFWIAEPSRTVYAYFLEEIANFPLAIEKVWSRETPKINEHILSARVNVWEVKRK